MPKRPIHGIKEPSSSQPELVWVTQGKTQHAAYLLESSSEHGHCVKWATTGVTEWIDHSHHVDRELSPRRLRKSAEKSPFDDRREQTTPSSPLEPAFPPPPVIEEHGSEEPTKPAADTANAQNSSSSSSDESDNDNDDDDEVEFLLVVQPPSPKRSKSSHLVVAASESHPQPTSNAIISQQPTTTIQNDEDMQNAEVAVAEQLNRRINGEHDDDDDDGGTPLSATLTMDNHQPSIRRDSAEKPVAETAAVPIPDMASIEHFSCASTGGLLPDTEDYCVSDTVDTAIETERGRDIINRQQAMEMKSNSITPSSSEELLESGEQQQSYYYTFRSSAYVQNLAEICHIMMWDERWRIGPDHQRLFAWESGDDLSAAMALSELYDEEPLPASPVPCPCLLCRRDNLDTNDTTLDMTGVSAATQDDSLDRNRQNLNDNKNLDEALPFRPDNGNSETPADKSNRKLSPDEEQHERSMHLFCRLFYRKGPWFRVDDIYHRYYAPKAAVDASAMETEESTDSDEDEEVAASTIQNGQGGDAAQSPGPTYTRTNSKGTDNAIQPDSMIDLSTLNSHLAQISVLLSDIMYLKRLGFLRSFQDEEECGKVVGTAQADRRGVLSADERRQILNKLGGGNGKKTRRMNSGESKSSNGSVSENEIWKQMCQQRSILGGLVVRQSNTNGKKFRALLPVLRHVNDLVLDKWIGGVIQACSRATYLPASILKATSIDVKRKILNAITELEADSEFCDESTKRHFASVDLCFRLREAPTHTLRRCARLFLCASSGPGSMRGDDRTSAWKSVQPLATGDSIPFSRIVPPPGLDSWHNIAYPCLNYRFGLTSFSFVHAYLTCKSHRDVYDPLKQVFQNRTGFRIWEVCVELRAQVDYLIESYETSLYQERRRLRLAALEEDDNNDDNDDYEIAQTSSKPVKGKTRDNQAHAIPKSNFGVRKRSIVDFWGLLTVTGRRQALKMFASLESTEFDISLELQVESDVSELFGVCEHESQKGDGMSDSHADNFSSDCERILAVIAIIIIQVMLRRHATITHEEITFIASRPWLRHLSWEGCLSYMLWDIIPVLERRGYHFLSVQAFEVLLFGRFGATSLLRSINASTKSGTWDGNVNISLPQATNLAPLLLSRRARGKGYERLVLDIQHAVRKALTSKEVDDSVDEGDDSKPQVTGNQQRDKFEKATRSKNFQQSLTIFCKQIVDHAAACASIPFSAIRVIARRLKQSLSTTLANHSCIVEVQELGLRLCNAPTEQSTEKDDQKYVDWVPITDTAVANAMEQQGMTSGRCSYVGFEDNGDESASPRSLNVEELAMEYYATGRLPLNPLDDNPESKQLRGGWFGWHDEGGHVRMLFRVLCSSLFGAWNGCCSQKCVDGRVDTEEDTTVYLSRYQGAPFDLHVGYTRNALSLGSGHGFYARHKTSVDRFLNKLSMLNSQELSDLVYDHISARVESYNCQVRKHDPQLERDLSHARTLSMLAAGFGGPQLAAMFRCFFFDYRHYSGGLPDLLLVRALYGEPVPESTSAVTVQQVDAATSAIMDGMLESSDSRGEEEVKRDQFVDVGDWVGEEFHPDRRAERALQQHANMLMDMDDEFLGCSKVGDSGATSRRSNGRQRTPRPAAATRRLRGKPTLAMPPRLELRHHHRHVLVQCMMVEVKSQNDRLDPRQEDWLNVIDRVGNARVCKFGKKVKKNKKKEEDKGKNGPTAG